MDFTIEPYYSPKTSAISWWTHYDGVLCTSDVVEGKVCIKPTERALSGEAAQRLAWAIQKALA